MAGSLSYQVYTSDNGQSYAIYCDKSNALAVNASAQAVPASLPPVTIPRSIRPRYALFRSDDGKVSRKVPLLKPSDVSALAADLSFTPTGATVPVKLSSVRGEALRIPRLTDTGLTT